LNLYEHEDHYTAEVAVPGARPESLEVTLEDGVLTVSGERPAPPASEHEKLVRRERGHGTFTRKIRLGRDVNRDAVSADYAHGILTVTLPKAEEAKPKKVAIRVGA
jgi:HSP20 family protein